MKTIAITIDEDILRRIDRLMKNEGIGWRSRSEVIREAVQDFINRVERMAEEKRERDILERKSSRLNRQAAALVKEQAKL